MRTHECIAPLMRAGISELDALALRRAAMRLHRWYEKECGDGSGSIERDEATDLAYWRSASARYVDPHDPRARWRIRDDEKGAMRQVEKILSRYPALAVYYQTDPRGAPLYILRPDDVPAGEDPGCYYSRGLAVYK